MDIRIFNDESMVFYRPEKPTFSIRVFNHKKENGEVMPLVNSDLYVAEKRYFFDDITLGDARHFDNFNHSLWFFKNIRRINYKVFDKDTARAIISDFKEVIPRTECLAVSCEYGAGRAPAIAIALNEIFSLGQDSNKMRLNFINYNSYVYEMLIRESRAKFTKV